MQTLKVTTRALSPARFEVLWQGISKKSNTPIGVLIVEVSESLPEPMAIAELTGLYHVLCERALFGRERSGRDLQIVVSRGVIRRLWHSRSTKTFLLPWAQFLRVRFAAARIHVDTKWVPIGPRRPAKEISAKAHNYEEHASPAGPVVVTRHAVERYAQKFCASGLDRAWHRLTTLLEEGSGECVSVRGGFSECWRVASLHHSALHMVVSREATAAKVVTVYP